MSKFHQLLKKNELSYSEKVDKEACLNAKKTMREEDFKATYFKAKNELGEYSYYKRCYRDIDDQEINTYLIYELLKTQRMLLENQVKIKTHTAIIMSIIVAMVILGVIGVLAGLGTVV